MSPKHGFCFPENVIDYDQIFYPMERPFERKSSDNEAKISRRRKETSSARDLIVEAYQDLGGVPHPIGVPPRERKSPTQSGEFKRAKKAPNEEQVVEIDDRDVELVDSEGEAEQALKINNNRLATRTREIIPYLGDISRQEARANARRGAKEGKQREKVSGSKDIWDEVDATPQTDIKKPRGFYPTGSLNEVIAKIDDIEAKILDLEDGHANLASNTRATEEELRAELEFLREGLGKTVGMEEKKENTLIEARPSADEELPDLQLNKDGRLTEREPGFVEPTKNKLPVKKEAKEANADPERLADKYGIVISPEARARRLHESNKVLKDHASELPEAIRLEQLLTDDEETLRTTTDITDSNKKSLTARIRETKKKLAPFSEVLGARNERETLLKYPTAAEEVEFNMAETENEIARTNPKNAIRLRQLHNTFADLERMKDVLETQESPKEPLPSSQKEIALTEAEQLAERFGITLNPLERKSEIAVLKGEVQDSQTKYNEIDDEITSLKNKLKSTHIIKVEQRLAKQIQLLEEQRNNVRDRYYRAEDRYNEALAAPATAEEEINARIQELRRDRNNGFNDTTVVDERIAGLERLKNLLPPPLPPRPPEAKDLGIDYSYTRPVGEKTPVDESAEQPYTSPLNRQTPESLKSAAGELEKVITKARQDIVNARDLNAQEAAVGRLHRLEKGRDVLRQRGETMQQVTEERSREATVPPPSLILEEKQPRRETRVLKTQRQPERKIETKDDRLLREYETVLEAKNRKETDQWNLAQGYLKEAKGIAAKLKEQGEIVTVPGEKVTEPKQSSWRSGWNKVKEFTFRRDIGALKRAFETAVERYEEALQTHTAIIRDIPYFGRVGARINGASTGAGSIDGATYRVREDNERLNEEEKFKQRLDTVNAAKKALEEIPMSYLAGMTPDGGLMNDQKRFELLQEFQTQVNDFNRLFRGLDKNDALYKKAQEVKAMEVPFTLLLGIHAEEHPTSEEVDDAMRVVSSEFYLLEAAASVRKDDRYSKANEAINALRTIAGGKNAAETVRRTEWLITAAMRIPFIEDMADRSKEYVAPRMKNNLEFIRDAQISTKAKEALNVLIKQF